MFGEIHQAATVRNKLGTDQLSDQLSKIGSYSGHTILEIFCKILTVVSNLNNLVSKCFKMVFVFLQNLSTHRDFCSVSYFLCNLFRDNF